MHCKQKKNPVSGLRSARRGHDLTNRNKKGRSLAEAMNLREIQHNMTFESLKFYEEERIYFLITFLAFPVSKYTECDQFIKKVN